MIYSLRHISSARFDRIAAARFRILSALDRATELMSTDLLITCGTDSHPVSDPHTTGEAYDVSVATLAPNQIVNLKHLLEEDLGTLFTVLYETPTKPVDSRLAPIAYVNKGATGPHLHIQRKKGMIYPPLEQPPTGTGTVKA